MCNIKRKRGINTHEQASEREETEKFFARSIDIVTEQSSTKLMLAEASMGVSACERERHRACVSMSGCVLLRGGNKICHLSLF